MNPRYEPKTEKQALGYLIEECGEVLAAAGKSLRWGWASCNPELPMKEREQNIDWLRHEMRDLARALRYARKLLPPGSKMPRNWP